MDECFVSKNYFLWFLFESRIFNLDVFIFIGNMNMFFFIDGKVVFEGVIVYGDVIIYKVYIVWYLFDVIDEWIVFDNYCILILMI